MASARQTSGGVVRRVWIAIMASAKVQAAPQQATAIAPLSSRGRKSNSPTRTNVVIGTAKRNIAVPRISRPLALNTSTP